MNNYFIYKEKIYGEGTIVKIHECYRANFEFRKYFIFLRKKENIFYFKYLYSSECYNFTHEDIDRCIQDIIVEKPVILSHPKGYKTKAKYIDCILEAWTWYLLVMFGALFVKSGTLIIWAFASYVFWSWRAKKMKGE